MKPQAAFVRAQCAAHLDLESAVHVDLPTIVLPRHAEHDDALGFDEPLDDLRLHQVGPAPAGLVESGGAVHAIGKISDIFAGRGITTSTKIADNAEGFSATLAAAREAGDRSLVFVNFNDFDTVYGHRRDISGYARALEAFDAPLVVILGGRHKECPYAPLRPALAARGRRVLAIGEAADRIEAELGGAVEVEQAGTLERAVLRASELAEPGDAAGARRLGVEPLLGLL